MMNKVFPLSEVNQDFVREEFVKMANILKDVQSSLFALQNEMSTMKNDISTMKNDISTMKNDMDSGFRSIESQLLDLKIYNAKKENFTYQSINKNSDSEIFYPLLNTNPEGSGRIGQAPHGHPITKSGLEKLSKNKIIEYQSFYGSNFDITSSDTKEQMIQKYKDWLSKQ